MTCDLCGGEKRGEPFFVHVVGCACSKPCAEQMLKERAAYHAELAAEPLGKLPEAMSRTGAVPSRVTNSSGSNAATLRRSAAGSIPRASVIRRPRVGASTHGRSKTGKRRWNVWRIGPNLRHGRVPETNFSRPEGQDSQQKAAALPAKNSRRQRN